MTYASQQALIDRYGSERLIQLTDRAGALDVIDAAVLAAAMSAVDSEIDSYLAARYTLPLAVVTPTLRDRAVELTYVVLHENAELVSDAVLSVGKNVRAWLRLVADGRLSIGVDQSTGASVAGNDGVVLQNGAARVFDRASYG